MGGKGKWREVHNEGDICTHMEDSHSSVSKEYACSAGDPGSIPGLGRSPGEGSGNPLQHPCLENLMDRGAWWGPWGHKESGMTEWLTHTYLGLIHVVVQQKPTQHYKSTIPQLKKYIKEKCISIYQFTLTSAQRPVWKNKAKPNRTEFWRGDS